MCVIRIRNIIPNDFTKHVCQKIQFFPNYKGPDKSLINILEVMESYGAFPYYLDYGLYNNGADIEIHPKNFYTALAFKGFLVEDIISSERPAAFCYNGIYYTFSEKELKESSTYDRSSHFLVYSGTRIRFSMIPPLYKKRLLELL